MTAELFQNPPNLEFKPDYIDACKDRVRIKLYIDNKYIEESVEKTGLFSDYRKKIENKILAEFFALTTRQYYGLFKYLTDLLEKIQEILIINNQIEILSNWFHPDNISLEVRINKISENKYQYTFAAKNSNLPEHDFCSISTTIEQEKNDIASSNTKVELSEQAANFLGVQKRSYGYEDKKTYPINEVTKLEIRVDELVGNDKYSHFDRINRLPKQTSSQPSQLSMDFFQKFIDVVISIFSKMGDSLSSIMGRGCSAAFFKPAMPVVKKKSENIPQEKIASNITCNNRNSASF